MDRRVRQMLITWLGLALTLTLTESAANGDEFYYVMIFGSQSRPKLWQYTHTWATFIRAVGEGLDADNYALYQHTISWLPESLDVRTWSLLPEPGVNLDLYQTLEAVYHDRENVTMWGPFRIHPVVYERSLWIKYVLDSGTAEYRAISTPRNMLISDCIHAVAAIDPIFGRDHYPLVRIGKPASRHIARQLMTRSLFDQWEGDHSWLIPRLGLNSYPIEFVAPYQIPKRTCFLCRCPD